MTIGRARIKTAIVFFIFCVVSAPQVGGQETPATSPQTLRVVMYNGDMAALLGHLANDYRTPIGFELAARQQGVAVNIDLRDVTFPQILDGIIKSAPGYQWRERDSSIEVLPVEAANPFLDTMVSNFRVRDVDQGMAISQLLYQPEIRNAMKAMGLKRRDPIVLPSEKRFTLTLSGLTMRQALNRIAKESGVWYWIFRSSSDGSFSISNALW
jgi:hypothetical protein